MSKRNSIFFTKSENDIKKGKGKIREN